MPRPTKWQGLTAFRVPHKITPAHHKDQLSAWKRSSRAFWQVPWWPSLKPKPTNWQGLTALRVPQEIMPAHHRPALCIPGNELVGRAFGAVLWVDHEEHVREAGAEVGPVGVVVSRRLGRVGVLTLWAVKLHHGFSGHIGQSCTQGNRADSVKKQRERAHSPLGNKGWSLQYTRGHEEAERQSTLTLKPVLNWTNVCSPEHTSDTSTNYDSFLN